LGPRGNDDRTSRFQDERIRALDGDAVAIKSVAEGGFEVVASAGIVHTQHVHDHEI
jgi:hypothetical protein